MRLAIIGRSEILFDTALRLKESGHDIPVIITSKEAPEYTKTAEDFRDLAKEYHSEFIQTTDISSAMGIIKKHLPIDLAISFNFPTIIPQSFIDCFTLGALNAHGGDLPRYRGNACQAWAIINGEKSIGLCIHYMVGDKLDSGDIVVRDRLDININTKITQIWDWMNDRIPSLYIEAVQILENDPDFILEVQSSDPSDALRCYPRKQEDGQINWSNSAEEILRLINACNKPYSGAFCEYKGTKMIIWDAYLAENESLLAIPGQISSIADEYVEVVTGDGKLKVFNVEVEGEQQSPVKIIRSTRDRLI